jgi:hypothetical protein
LKSTPAPEEPGRKGVTSVHIFVDESGNFATESRAQGAISVVGALMIPSAKMEWLEKKYRTLRPGLKKDPSGEVKCRLNGESEIARVIDLLRKNEVLYEATVIDTDKNSAQQIEAHKLRRIGQLNQALQQRELLGSSTLAWLQGLRDQLTTMGLPLYSQSAATISLLDRAIELSVAYYAQRRPEELAHFHWVIDSKEKGRISDWEQWWTSIILPIMQHESALRPRPHLRVGDYQHFSRFQVDLDALDGSSERIAELAAAHGMTTDEFRQRAAPAVNITALLGESRRFSSGQEMGLELVDIVTGALRRALVGNLQEKGWEGVPGLMIDRPHQYFELPLFVGAESGYMRVPYDAVLRRFTQGGRPMMAQHASKALGNSFDYFKYRELLMNARRSKGSRATPTS